MRAIVDPEFCELAGECLRLVPDVFVTGSDGSTRTVDGPVPAELEEEVALAVDSCPRLAISLLP